MSENNIAQNENANFAADNAGADFAERTDGLDERLHAISDAVAKMEQAHTKSEGETKTAKVAGQTRDMVQVGRPDSDEEQIEIRTPKFSRQHILHLLILFGILFVGFTFVFQIYFTPISVVGQSMMPTLNQSSKSSTDYTHTDLIYCEPASRYRNGDIVVTDTKAYPGQADSIIKRVIAIEGQTIKFERTSVVTANQNGLELKYKIYLDGVELKEDYIYTQEVKLTYPTAIHYESYEKLWDSLSGIKGEYSVTIPKGYVFLMGDNRNNSTDSRFFGAIETKHIAGKVVLHIPYGTNFFVGLWKSLTGKGKISTIKIAA